MLFNIESIWNRAVSYNIILFFLIIIPSDIFNGRFELSCHYISWKLFWKISHRNDTLLKGVTNQLLETPGIELAPPESGAELNRPHYQLGYWPGIVRP